MSKEICFMPATELAGRIRRGELSPVEATEAFLARIEERNTPLNAYVTLLPERAREQAKRAEKALKTGEALGALHGVPIAIKDLFDALAGVRNTRGSKLFASFVPPVTSTYIERLETAGAIILGKTNTPEFGHKGTTDNYLFGPTSTPFAIGKNAGGSSGGSAAAVADGLAALAQGSDAGGSIRIPASCCGVYGLKPSAGRVADVVRPNGFHSQAPFIQSGPLTRTVEDAALMLGVMAGPHPRDPLSLPDEGLDFMAATRRSIKGLKIAFSPNLDTYPIDKRVREVVARAAAAFADAGAVVEEVKVGMKRSHHELTDLWVAQMAVISALGARAFKALGLDLFGKDRGDVAPELVAKAERGMAMSAVDYKALDVVRTEVFDAIQNLFDTHDVLLTPTLCVPPFDNADNRNTVGPSEVEGEKVETTIGWCLTPVFNFTGHPAASIPAGLTEDGLPIGMQIVGRRFADDTVLAVSAAFERLRPWHATYPGR